MEQNNSLSNKPSTQTERKASLQIATSFELWDFLLDGRAIANQSKGTKHRYTKAEAFFDLLDRQRISQSTFDDGYMNSSVLLLANSWGWMRPTAKKFLDTLAEMKVITLTPMGNRIVVRLNNIMGEDTQTSQSEDNNEIKAGDTPPTTLQGNNVRQEPDKEPGTIP